MSATIEDLNSGVTGFDRLYGLRFVSCDEQRVSAEVPIDDRHLQPVGIVHGGVYTSIAESTTTVATILAVAGQGNIAVGLSNSTSFLRPLRQGTIHALGLRLHRGRTTWVWDVTMTDDDGRICALTRMTIAVRPNDA
jgi:1,4-dihydroxy-2-naphthoyl-CoA hydrolase